MPGSSGSETPAEWPKHLVTAAEWKPKAEAQARRQPSSGTTAYGRAALEGLFIELRGVPQGQRDDRRNKVAYRAGRLVAGGHLLEQDAEEMVVAACAENGLLEDLGEAALRKRVQAGIAAGIAAGPQGPAPSESPRKVVVTSQGVDDGGRDNDEQQTDVGNGRRLVRLFGSDLRWCKPLGWLAWDGERWARSEHRAVGFAKESARLMRIESEALDGDERKIARKHALASEKAERIRAAVAMAQGEPGIPVAHDALDSDPWLLSVANGAIDLRTGKIRPHSRQDLVTRAASVRFDPEAKAPRFEQFLAETFGADTALVDFIKKAVGYSLTGITSEQALFLCHGVGSNGKSTLLGTLRLLLGDHATNADFSTFLLSSRGQQPGPRGDLARLAGIRLVTSTEPEGSARFSEGTVKSITGGDPLTCSFKFQDEFTFTPKFKLWLGANDKPRIRGTGHAIWRRIRLIPFLHVVTDDKIDKNLDLALAKELPGILNIAIAGCLKWQAEGLAAPESVLGATKAYREEQDILADYLSECCFVAPGYDCLVSEMFDSYRDFSEKAGDEPVSKRALTMMLCERGVTRGRDPSGSSRIYIGVAVKEKFKVKPAKAS